MCMCQIYLQPFYGGLYHPDGTGAMAGVGYQLAASQANLGAQWGIIHAGSVFGSMEVQLLSPQVTTDLRHRCTDGHTGTSVSAPMVAGIIALALEAK